MFAFYLKQTPVILKCSRSINSLKQIPNSISSWRHTGSAIPITPKVEIPGESGAISESIAKDVLDKVNSSILKKHQRVFAIIQLLGQRFKITTEDIISLKAYFPANVGEKIILEKVLAVGSTDFTIFGRPLLSKEFVHIDATIVEKTYIVPRPLFRFSPRKHYSRLHWFRSPYTLIRINEISLSSLDEIPVEGIQGRVIY